MRKPAVHLYQRDKQRRMIVQAGVCYQRRILPVVDRKIGVKRATRRRLRTI